MNKSDTGKLVMAISQCLGKPDTKILFMVSATLKARMVFMYLVEKLPHVSARATDRNINFLNGSTIYIRYTTDSIMGMEFDNLFLDEYCDGWQGEFAKLKLRSRDASFSYFNMDDLDG